MIAECPHCHSRVFISADGRCPACRKDTLNLDGADPNITRLELRIDDRLPPNCFVCNTATQRTTKWRAEIDSEAPRRWVLFVLSLLRLNPVAAVVHLLNRSEPRLEMNLPQCEVCAGKEKPEASHVDFNNHLATFLVHRAFREQVLSARSGCNT